MATNIVKEKNLAMRVADIGPLPKRMLAPIEGYEKLPLVTLEEAVKPLATIVPKVERNVYIVKQNCKKPADGLTTDESASIMLYTYESMPYEDSLYVKLNQALRSEQRKNLIPWFLYLRLILTALFRLPSECCPVFRGVKESLWFEYTEGKKFIWWGFSSCTLNVGVLKNEQFLGKQGKRTLFQIKCIAAKNIKEHSFIPSEDEMLLLPARQFKVKACLDMGHELHMVQLEELKPPYDLLEPVPIPTPSIKPAGGLTKTLSKINLQPSVVLASESSY